MYAHHRRQHPTHPQGRAQVEMTLKKGQPGEKFEVKGKQYETITVRMVVDGWNAPVTGGNFVDLVNKGFYNNKVRGEAVCRSLASSVLAPRQHQSNPNTPSTIETR